MRILAVDYGERRTGLAVSDELGISAHGLDTIEVADETEIPARVAQVAKETDAKKIVVGLPLNMDGTESEKSKKVREFAGVLSLEISVPVVFWDERMSSLQAQKIMNEMEVKTYKNKHIVDRISATLILQEFMKTISWVADILACITQTLNRQFAVTNMRYSIISFSSLMTMNHGHSEEPK